MCLGRWPLRRAIVRGASMLPTLSDGDIVLVAATIKPPRTGSVALVRWEHRPGQLSIKRVVGPDGDGWWVVGDNRNASTDSRSLGSAIVVGRVLCRLWPRPGRLRNRPRLP